MKFFKVAAAALVGFSTLSVAAAAHATEIDFTDIGQLGGNPDGASSWTVEVDGVVVTITPGPSKKNAELSWDSDDGFGVTRPTGDYAADEVQGRERLTVTFTDTSGNPVDVQIDSFSVSDLFNEKENRGNKVYAEIGKYRTDGAAHTFTAGTVLGHDNSNGTGTVLVGVTDSMIVFTAPGIRKKGKQDHEYALAGLSFTVLAVPELDARSGMGAAVLLCGVGLVLAAPRRRRLAVQV